MPVTLTSEPLAFSLPFVSAADALSRASSGALLVDLRKPAARAADGRALPGAMLLDPFAFGHDHKLMVDSREIITFCVHGHEVSQFGCALLMLHGRQASYVLGGFQAIAATGVALQELPQ